MPSTWKSAVVMSAPRTWSMLPTLIPAAMAFLTSSTMPAPYSGWVMIASYLPEATAFWSFLSLTLGAAAALGAALAAVVGAATLAAADGAVDAVPLLQAATRRPP